MDLEKELEKNKKYRKMVYLELEEQKRRYITEMKDSISKEIRKEFQKNKEIKKDSFWSKLIKIFK